MSVLIHKEAYVDVSIGARIKAARTAAGMTQMDVARRTDLSLQAVGDIERGIVRDPHISSLRQIARALGIPVTQVLEDPEVALAGSPKAEAPTETGLENLSEVLTRLGSPTQYLADPELGTRVLEATHEEADRMYEATLREVDVLTPELGRWLATERSGSPRYMHTTKLWVAAGERLLAMRWAMRAKRGAELVPVELTQAADKLEKVLVGTR